MAIVSSPISDNCHSSAGKHYRLSEEQSPVTRYLDDNACPVFQLEGEGPSCQQLYRLNSWLRP